MNKIKLNFASPEKSTSNGISPQQQSIEKVLENTNGNGGDTEANTKPSPPIFIIKTPRPNSKLILQNMEEVLNSVKKKHRQKHRRKREEKKLAQLEAEAVSVAIKAKAMKEEVIPKTQIDKKKSKKPLQEQTEQLDNGMPTVKSKHRKISTSKSPLKTVAVNETILKHFTRTPKKGESIEQQQIGDNHETEANTGTQKKTANAFDVLMNARNKSIGSNTPGKEAPTVTSNEPAASVTNVKRKIFLQEWADKKGASKRKLDEESRAAHVDRKLENRAKRFKKMLAASPASSTTSKVLHPTEANPDKLKENCSSKTKKNSRNNKADKLSNSSKPLPDSEEKYENFASKSMKKPGHDKLVKPKQTRGRRSLRRLSSADSVELKNNCTQDSETEEFLSKLSSPTKKRDSLLGYFPKKESPKEIATKVTTVENGTTSVVKAAKDNEERHTPNRARRSRAKRVVENTSSQAMELQSVTDSDGTTSTPIARPRRSCAGKARYDYDTQVTQTKLEKISKSAHVSKSQLEFSSTESTEIIELDESTSSITPQETPTKKLAPLFVRAVPKPTPDPVMLKARQDFLMSGVPEKLRLEKAKQKQFEQSFDEALELFPKVSHIFQLSVEELNLLAEKNTLSFKLKKNDGSTVNHSRRLKEGKSRNIGSISNLSAKELRNPMKAINKTSSFPLQQPLLSMLDNKRAIIKSWKINFERFPTYKCYNQMREKYRYFSAIDSAQDTEQVTESFVVTRRTRRSLEALKKFDPDAEEEKPPPTAPNGELLFTEKYKPMLFEQVLVNLTPVTQLRDFLSNWSAGLSARNSQGFDESFDFANDSNSSQHSSCNTVVLLGPGSSGKTNAVFALANELNFNVLEINAGMKRTGKKLIQELQEATQSHQIRKESSGGKVQKNLLKISLNGLKTKQSKQASLNIDFDGNSCSPGADLVNTVRKSLILIEDADIVFEQMDAGFTDAIYTLAASSKRPVIIVASNPNCQHLQRLMHQCTIHFSPPNVLNISKFLAILALIENCPVNLDDLISLYLYNQCNLRKTLLELQFFIQSGGDRKQLEIISTQNKEKSAQDVGSQYFASPSKRRFSEEPTSSQVAENDELLSKEIQVTKLEVKDKTYMHRNLFEFYTTSQNEKYRIPFPIDFHLLHINLNDIFQVSKNLREELSNKISNNSVKNGKQPATVKRKSRSPKKLWLNTAAAELSTPLDALSDFYENISIASLLCAHNSEGVRFTDRLIPNLAEDISHALVERAIELNLEATACPYNLFDTPKERHSLIDQMNPLNVRTQRTCSLDFEPVLRSICRSEKLRSTLERRSTRFYHYLRNSSVNLCNFSTEHFDNACSILYDDVAVTEVGVVDNASLS